MFCGSSVLRRSTFYLSNSYSKLPNVRLEETFLLPFLIALSFSAGIDIPLPKGVNHLSFS